MKIAILGDVHYGVRNDNIYFIELNKKFFNTLFFPYIKTHNIDCVIQLGDLVDRRKYINFNTLNRMRMDFLEPLQNCNIPSYFIAGNHDCTYKNTNYINSLRELLFEKYNFEICDMYCNTVTFDGLDILLVPWICDDNRKMTYEKVKSTSAQICMGHLELSGFPMHKGHISTEGDDPSLFNRFDMVFSGHYHTRSRNGNIHYLGAHSEFTWSDYNDPRGFNVFDTSTREIDFIENPYKIHKKIYYKDNIELPNDCSESIIKVIIQSKNDLYNYDKFIDHIEKQNPIELQVVEDHLNLDLEDDEHIVNEAESTIDIFKKYIDKSNITNKPNVEKVIMELYNEALSME